MTIEKHTLNVSTTGSAAAATGSAVASVPLSELVAVHLDFHASAPATTDTTISSPGNPLALTILTVSNSATDGWYYPTVNLHDNAASAVAGAYAAPVVHGNLLVSLAGSDALTNTVVCTFYLRV